MNVLSIDVEEYFHVSAFEDVVKAADWERFESRVEATTGRLLDRLSAAKASATFFVLGWVAERHPALVRRIHAEGHEVACHGYGHQVLTDLTPDQFRADVRRAKAILEDLVGEPVLGYRAPSFTIMEDTVWALRILVEEGYRYDSSIFPVWHDRYGLPGANPACHRIMTGAGPIWEVPPSTLAVGRTRMPVAGGGYLRLWPYPLLRTWLKRIESAGQPLVLYLHPWEIDPDQPRLRGPMLSRCRHYLNLDKTEARVARLLGDFRFGAIREALRPRWAGLQEQVA
ncbi:XrtA system polysaccharide deacetylase [Candidatus Nitrospira bockiana]